MTPRAVADPRVNTAVQLVERLGLPTVLALVLCYGGWTLGNRYIEATSRNLDAQTQISQQQADTLKNVGELLASQDRRLEAANKAHDTQSDLLRQILADTKTARRTSIP